MKNTVILLNLTNQQDIKTLEKVERAYMIGSSVAVVCFDDGSEYYYTNYKIVTKK